MIEPLTPVVELHSRLGRVGSIQAWNPWKSRESVTHAKWWISKVASLSYGNTEAKSPEKLFQSIVDRGHLSCLEFVPFEHGDQGPHLPCNSLRTSPDLVDIPDAWGDQVDEATAHPAHAFLVECPLYVRSQWMRHRSFSYLEMSRRYTKGSKVAWTFYGSEDPVLHAEQLDAVAKYERRLEAGMPPELARGIIPQEAMTRFWACGFDRDWDHFCKEREHLGAQAETRTFAVWIREQIGHGPF